MARTLGHDEEDLDLNPFLHVKRITMVDAEDRLADPAEPRRRDLPALLDVMATSSSNAYLNFTFDFFANVGAVSPARKHFTATSESVGIKSGNKPTGAQAKNFAPTAWTTMPPVGRRTVAVPTSPCSAELLFQKLIKTVLDLPSFARLVAALEKNPFAELRHTPSTGDYMIDLLTPGFPAYDYFLAKNLHEPVRLAEENGGRFPRADDDRSFPADPRRDTDAGAFFVPRSAASLAFGEQALKGAVCAAPFRGAGYERMYSTGSAGRHQHAKSLLHRTSTATLIGWQASFPSSASI